MEDLIQNAHTLFDGRLSPTHSPPVPSYDEAETRSTETYGSLFLSPDSRFPRSAEIQATGSTSRHHSGLVDRVPASTESSFSLFPSDGAVGNGLTPPQTALLSPLHGLSSTKKAKGEAEKKTQQRHTKARGKRAKSPLPYSEAPMIPQSPPESIASSASDLAHSSATSLQTTMGSP